MPDYRRVPGLLLLTCEGAVEKSGCLALSALDWKVSQNCQGKGKGRAG